MEICPLAERPDLVPIVAECLYRQFGHLNPSASLERSIVRMKERLNTQGYPITFISLDQGILTGTASLIASDFESIPELTPWLASVYVQPDLRRTGIGSQLSKRVAQHAKKCGHEKLFLFTPNMQPFFATLGWRQSKVQQYHGVEVSIMELAL